MAKFKRKYTLGEEIFNSVSHGIGAGLSIAGTVVLIVTSAIHTNAWGVVSSCIYGASLIILYTMSTLYHSFTNEKVKSIFPNNGSQHDFSADCRNIHTDYSLLPQWCDWLDSVRNCVGIGNFRNSYELNQP